MLFFLQVNSWIHEKLQTATDESYKDPTNLESKMQKHQAFEAEITTNKARMDTVCKVKKTRKCQIQQRAVGFCRVFTIIFKHSWGMN